MIRNLFKNLDIAEKIQLGISYLLRISLLIAIISAIINENWLTLFMASFALTLTFLPALIERNYKIYLPTEFEFIVTIFIYASLFLGEVHKYYMKFWWWDLFLHSVAGITFGFLGFFIMYVLHKGKKVATSPVLIALFSFSFALAIGSVWEIFEFSIDRLLGANMQKSGLMDTMGDLIVNGSAALLTALIGYFYVKDGPSLLVNRFLTKFIQKNPQLFKKKSRNLK